MGFQDDWVLRQIEMISRYVAQLIFRKTHVEYSYETSDMLSQTDQLHLALDGLIREKRLCEAEDMLFDNMTFDDKYIELAMDFYQKLNTLTDAELEEGDFSRDEIYDGYIDILGKLGVPIEQFCN